MSTFVYSCSQSFFGRFDTSNQTSLLSIQLIVLCIFFQPTNTISGDVNEPISCRCFLLPSTPAAHQSGNNSGIVHAGIYYSPGSLKAQLCVKGLRMAFEYFDEHDIPYVKCGKVGGCLSVCV